MEPHICNRSACRAVQHRGESFWWNVSTEAWYCGACARRINEACKAFGEPVICFKEVVIRPSERYTLIRSPVDV